MNTYSRRQALALASSGAALVATGIGVSQAASGEPAQAACSSIPSSADDAVLTTVYRVATGLSANERVLLAGFEAGWVESRMNNLPCGDSDSLGVFQQRPSQGWGTPAQILNVSYAANSFFVRAIPLAAANPGWSAGQVAQGVQRSAFPDRYDAARATAQALIARARGLTTPPPLDLWKDDMRLIQSPNRGIALIGAGYFRQLSSTEEVQAAVLLVGNPLIGNDRQFDLWRSIAFDGQVKAPN
ncbi:hypothetical protein [Micromonospora zamorensis]|uniref:hypothetical protein n=1 Tax=Micromonospora zamorensis TaxID=709883 RepID=UPI00081F7E25|nr:hypothetical protein GA0070619_6091 [Micromonospora zamorensis]